VWYLKKVKLFLLFVERFIALRVGKFEMHLGAKWHLWYERKNLSNTWSIPRRVSLISLLYRIIIIGIWNFLCHKGLLQNKQFSVLNQRFQFYRFGGVPHAIYAQRMSGSFIWIQYCCWLDKSAQTFIRNSLQKNLQFYHIEWTTNFQLKPNAKGRSGCRVATRKREH
jgi:hypothetical protein